MLRYDLGKYRPAGLPLHPGMGQPVVRAAVGFSSLVVAGLGAGTAYVGLRAGQRERGTARRVVSYAVAVFGALVALSGVSGLIGSVISPIFSGNRTQA